MKKDTLEHLVNLGFSSYEIAKETGVCPTTVRNWLKKFTLTTVRTFTREELLPLVEAGLSSAEIAKTIHSSATTVRRWLKKFGFSTTSRKGPRPYRCKIPICRHCGETDSSQFASHKSICRSCRSQQSKHILREHKRQAVEAKGGKCCFCGYDKCLGALQFHHLRDKTPEWMKLRRKAAQKITDELDKCILVCANCHAEIHWSHK